MKFIANISMCDPTFYVPLAQAAEAAGFDTIAVPDSIAYPKESRFPSAARLTCHQHSPSMPMTRTTTAAWTRIHLGVHSLATVAA